VAITKYGDASIHDLWCGCRLARTFFTARSIGAPTSSRSSAADPTSTISVIRMADLPPSTPGAGMNLGTDWMIGP
jgi:hypothetical protein